MSWTTAPPADHGHGQDADALVGAEGQGLERAQASRGIPPGGGREGQPARAERARAAAGTPEGVEELEQLVRHLRPQQLAQRVLGRGRRPAVRLLQHLGERHERRVEVLGEAPREDPVGEGADQDEDHEEQARVPEGEPRPDGERAAPRHPSPSFMTYPAPRTVWSSRGSPGPSILRRRYPTYTSTTLLPGSKSSPHTRSESCGRVEHAPGAPHEALEEGVLARGQLDAPVAPGHLARGRVEGEGPHPEHRSALPLPAPQERPHPGEQLVERERLGQVVVGAEVEASHAVGDAVARGQEQDRRLDAALAHGAHHAEPVAARQHHVEDDQVVGRTLHDEVERALAVRGQLHRVALLLQPLADEARHLALVLHHQHAHVGATVTCVPTRTYTTGRAAPGRAGSQ